jgi:peptide-methionine (S)-S-oxide reductase
MKEFIFIYVLALIWIVFPVKTDVVQQTKQNMTEFQDHKLELATFGGGCFWCTEAVFSRINGVKEVFPGYAGGHKPYPTYEEVTRGETGHAEVVQISFDPEQVSYIQLLEVFFKTHDPTTLNRQGNDVGTQYRSIILFHDEHQQKEAEKVKTRLNGAGIWDNPIVTEIIPLQVFFIAESYHHNYFAKNPDQGYCQFVILPKVQKFKQLFEELLVE